MYHYYYYLIIIIINTLLHVSALNVLSLGRILLYAQNNCYIIFNSTNECT